MPSAFRFRSWRRLALWRSGHARILLPLLIPAATSWQPQDSFPLDAASEGFADQVLDLRCRARELPDGYLVCLVGDTITEEALPTYQTWINTLEGVRDSTACDNSSPWGVWTRAWTAEENRHGDSLNRYLYLYGRVDMGMIQRTIQYLIGSGMDMKIDKDPYTGFIYTSFQERAVGITQGSLVVECKPARDEYIVDSSCIYT